MAITTSPYINGPDILEHATRTVKEVHLDFSGVADGCIKAGSPISAAGKVANDATAIGILLHDNYSDCGCGHGMVVVAGRIKADVAEQHSGIKISPEAKGGMPAVAFVDAAGIVTGGGNTGGSTPGGTVELPEPLQCSIEEKSYPETTVYHNDAVKSETINAGDERFFKLTNGEEYKITWNGKEYTGKCSSGYIDIYEGIGHLSIYSGDSYASVGASRGGENFNPSSLTIVAQPRTETVIDPIDPRIVTMYEVEVTNNWDGTYTISEDIFPMIKAGVKNICLTDGRSRFYPSALGVDFATFSKCNDSEVASLSVYPGSTECSESNGQLIGTGKGWLGAETGVLNPYDCLFDGDIRLRRRNGTTGEEEYYDITVDDSGNLVAKLLVFDPNYS